MPKVHYIQTSFTAGVLDPRMAGRTDIRQYYQGMSIGRNVLPVPLGGAKRRPGLKYVATLPGTQTALHSTATATAANGGTANNARDDDWDTAVTTNVAIGTTNPYVVIHYDLGSAQSVRAADVIGLAITSGSSTQFAIQYSTDDSAWSTFATLSRVDTIERSYRNRAAAAVSARYWRVARIGATNLGSATAQIRDFLLWSESATVSNVRLLPFSISTDDAYVVAATDRSIQIYDTDTDALSAAVPCPIANADISEIDYAQAADSMILVHEDYPPVMLVRDTVNSLWYIQQIEFRNIPDFDFADSSSPASTDDIQSIAFSNFVEGNTFQLELGGARTGAIVYQGTADADHIAATEENIRRAVQNLYTVGLSGVSVDYDASDSVFVITFSEDSADNLDVISGTPLTAGSTAAIAALKIQNGVSRREPVWSNTRGWPRTVTFHEGRLYFGGSRSLPQSVFGSVVNDFFNFDIGAALDDDAIFITLNTAQLNKITAIFSGRDLQLFTSGGEFRFMASPITPANAAPRNQTQYGAAQVKPVSTDGATVFIQKTRKVLRDFLFRYEEDAYSSVPISVLAAHLLNNVQDMAAWQGDGEDDANIVMLANGDGTIAAHVTLRSQEIAAWSQWTTDGTYEAVCSAERERYCAVNRTINGTSVLFLEHFDEDYRLDASIAYSGASTSTVTGLSHLNGEQCRVRSGNIILDDATPSGGSISVTGDGGAYSATSFEVGLNWTPIITTMPLNSDFGNGDNFMRRKRIVKGRINVYESLGLLYNGRVLPDDHWDVDNWDEVPEPFTGVHSLEESSNWEEGPLTQTLSQSDPLPFHILAAEFIVETS